MKLEKEENQSTLEHLSKEIKDYRAQIEELLNQKEQEYYSHKCEKEEYSYKERDLMEQLNMMK